jgi:Concanavalin A-like lectin/glucanases superfamily
MNLKNSFMYQTNLLSLLTLATALLGTNLTAYSQCTAPPPGMVSWWPGDGNTNDIRDGNDGSLQNGTTFSTGMVGQAFSFDGVDDFVQVPNAANLDFERTDAFSIDAWILTSETTLNHFIVANRQLNAPFKGYALMIDNGETPKCYANDPTPAGAGWLQFLLDGSDTSNCPRDHALIVYGSTALNDGQWHHVAANYDGSSSASGMRLYVDGILETGVLVLDDNLGTNSVLSSDPFSIGAGSGNGPQPFQGEIDEVEVFNRVLTDQEVADIFSAGSAGKCKTPLTTVVASPTRIREGNSSTFTVSLSLVAQTNTKVGFAMSGNATLATDYTLTGAQLSGNRGRVTIPAGQSSATVTLNALTDGITEGIESATMTLASGNGYTVGTPRKVTVRISDP